MLESAWMSRYHGWRRGRRLGLVVVVAVVAVSALAQNKAVAQHVAKAPVKRTAIAPAQVTINDATFHSAALGRDMKYRIVLPAGYELGRQRYPVLYLLHGLMGSYVDWESRANLVRYVEPLQLIVVMADAGNSWYTNSASESGDKYEDYIAGDLIAEVDDRYRTIRSGYGRAIAGLSMGGYGALKIALKHPGLFAFAGSFSGALNAGTALDVPLPKAHQEHMVAVFGPPESPTRTDNDVFALLKKAQATAFTRPPYFYVDCGTSDAFLKTNREFVAQLQQQKIAYEYHEFPGAHMWEYWDAEVQLMLASLARHMKIPAR